MGVPQSGLVQPSVPAILGVRVTATSLLPMDAVMTTWILLVVSIAVPAVAQTVPVPDVSMRWSSDTILLGEPVWVLVTARNASSGPVWWNPGDHCPPADKREIAAVVREDTAVSDARSASPGPWGIQLQCGRQQDNTTSRRERAPTWRYLFQRGVLFTRAGTYHVELTLHPGKSPRGVLSPPDSATLDPDIDRFHCVE